MESELTLRERIFALAYEVTDSDDVARQIADIYEPFIKSLLDRETKKAYDLLYWKYKELNGQSVDMKFVEAYNLLTSELTKKGKK